MKSERQNSSPVIHNTAIKIHDISLRVIYSTLKHSKPKLELNQVASLVVSRFFL